MTNLSTLVRVNSTDTMTLREFFEHNRDGIEPDEQSLIIARLARDGMYEGGGGASPEWCVELESRFHGLRYTGQSKAVERAVAQITALRGWMNQTRDERAALMESARRLEMGGMPAPWAANWLRIQLAELDAPFVARWSLGRAS